MNLKSKLVAIGLALTAFPLIIVSGTSYFLNVKMKHRASEESLKLAYSDLDHIARGISNMIQSQQEVLQEHVSSGLNLVDYLVSSQGG